MKGQSWKRFRLHGSGSIPQILQASDEDKIIKENRWIFRYNNNTIKIMDRLGGMNGSKY
jgi:hypothetical protein